MENCPCCRNKLEGILDYPKVYIHEFKRLTLPESVGNYPPEEVSVSTNKRFFLWSYASLNVPKKVLDLFGLGKEVVSHKGKVYKNRGQQEPGNYDINVESSEDITEYFKKALKLPGLEQALLSLEGFEGKEISREELKKAKWGYSKIEFGKNSDWVFFSLLYNEDSESKRESESKKKCLVVLDGRITPMPYSGFSAMINQPLAEIIYEGRFELQR
jgi:hypothetical protein